MTCYYKCSGADIKGAEKQAVFVLSTAFFAVFSAFIAIQNLQSTLNSEGGLGIICLAIVYASYIISAVFAPLAIRTLTAKGCVISAFVSHILYSSSNFYPSFWTMVPSSFLLGINSGFLWTAQGMYISLSAVSLAENKNIDLKLLLGKFHGIFLLFMSFPRILGNTLSSVILLQGKYNESEGSQNTTATKVCGSKMCPDSTNDKATIALPDMSTIHILMSVFLTLNICGLLLTIFFLPKLPHSVADKSRTTGSTITAFFRIHRKLEIALLVPSFLLISVSESFRWTDISKAYVSCPYGLSLVGFTLATHGFFGGICALLSSKIATVTGRQPIVILTIMGFVGTYITFILWTPTDSQLPYMIVFIAFQGVLEGCFSSQIQALLSFLFPDKTASTFSSFATWRAFGSTAIFILSNFLCVFQKIIIILVICTTAGICYAMLEIRIRKRRKYQEESVDSEVRVELKDND